jgi:2-phosphosulfolactate phosphatase
VALGSDGETVSRQFARWELEGIRGAVVVVDVIRAFTTAAYAFGAGAAAIHLVGTVAEALEFKARHPGSMAVGEDHGLRPDGFDFPNSPALVSRADLTGRTLVQRTSAGTQGALAARHADRLWVAGLACASATARAVTAAGLGAPVYVITGRFPDDPDRSGADDVLAASTIEDLRCGRPVDADAVATRLLATDEAARTLRLGPEHCDPHDIELAARVDVFDFAMEVERTPDGLRVTRSKA